MSKVVIAHLLSGVEVLCELIQDENEPDTLTLKNPTQIAVGHNPQTGQVDVHMAPLLPLAAKKELSLHKNQISFTYEPVNDIVNKFNQMFGSGLIVPESGKILKP